MTRPLPAAIAASRSSFRAQFDDPVGMAQKIGVVFGRNHRMTSIAQVKEDQQQPLDVGKV